MVEKLNRHERAQDPLHIEAKVETAWNTLQSGVNKLIESVDNLPKKHRAEFKRRERERQLALRHNGDWDESMLGVFGAMVGAAGAYAVDQPPVAGAGIGFLVGQIGGSILHIEKWKDYLSGESDTPPEKFNSKRPGQYMFSPEWKNRLHNSLFSDE